MAVFQGSGIAIGLPPSKKAAKWSMVEEAQVQDPDFRKGPGGRPHHPDSEPTSSKNEIKVEESANTRME